MPVSEPDFAALQRETVWSVREWRDAWTRLGDRRLWPTVVEMCKKSVARPTDAADMLTAAMDIELRP